MKVSSEELAVVAGGNDTLARHADTARLADNIARHEVLASLRRLTTYLHQPKRISTESFSILHLCFCIYVGVHFILFFIGDDM